MKLLIVIPSLAKGGAERVAATVSPFLSTHFEVVFVVYHPVVEYEVAGKIIHLNIPQSNTTRGKIINTIRETKLLRSIIKQERPDLVLSFMSMIPPVLSFHKTVLSIHTHYERMTIFDKLALKTIAHFGHVKGVLVPSDGLKQSLITHTGLSVTTVDNPVDIATIEQQSQKSIPQTKPFILTVGRLVPIKQFDFLIQVYAMSSLKSAFDLIIIGEGPERENLMKLVEKYELTDRVHLIGQIDNPFAYMRQARVLTVTSKMEVLGYTLVESLACHTPVIAVDCDFGPREIIQPEQNGLLVPVNNEAAFIHALERVCHDDALYNHLKSNARSSIERFSLPKVGQEWLQIIGSFVKNYV